MDKPNLLEALELQELTPDQQEEILAEMSDVIVQGTMLRLMDAMDEQAQIEFEKLLDSDAAEEVVDAFIKQHVPNSDKFLEDTVNELRDDILAETSK